MDQTSVITVDAGVASGPMYMESLVGLEIARCATVILVTWMVYEYLITLDQEVKHFWKGPFKISHYLFFFNRYFPPMIVITGVSTYFVSNPSLDFCRIMVPSLLLLTLLSIGVIQAILITRVWFLYPGSTILRFIVCVTFVATKSTSLAFLYISANQLQFIHIINSTDVLGCRATRPPGFWRVFLPNLILHTVLYLLTAYETLTNPDYKKKKDLRRRLLRDGGIFYLVVFVSVTFCGIASFVTDNPRINIPAIYSPIILATTSLATTRIMFSLRAITHELDESLIANFEWLAVSDPTSDAATLVGARSEKGRLSTADQTSTIIVISNPPTYARPPLSRFSVDSDVLPAEFSRRNRLILPPTGLPMDEETGLQNKNPASMATARTAGTTRDEAVPQRGNKRLRTLLSFPVPAFVKTARPWWA